MCLGMRSEPVTWSQSDRIVYRRQDAARLRNMAEAETRSSIRDQLACLSRECCRIADGISRLLRRLERSPASARSRSLFASGTRLARDHIIGDGGGPVDA